MKECIIIIVLIIQFTTGSSQNWKTVGGGTDYSNHTVYDFIEMDSVLYICGAFDSIGGSIYSEGMGIWNDSNWISCNIDFFNGVPTCFAIHNGELYFAGGFQRVNGDLNCRKIARRDFNGNYFPLGSGITDGIIVNCLASYNNELIVGGLFTEVDDSLNTNRIARWDGSSWQSFGSGITGGFGDVRCMAVFQNELYVAGDFGYIDGLPVRNICKWNGITWDSVGTGVYGIVFSMFVDNIQNRLYVGGIFQQAGNTTAMSGVAYWDGTDWHAAGNDPFVPAYSIFVYDGIVYNGTTQSGIVNGLGDTINNICWLDGTTWRSMGGGISVTPFSFEEYKNQMFVGGPFQYAGDSLVLGIAKWDPGSLELPEYSNNNSLIVIPNPAKEEVEIEYKYVLSAKAYLEISDVLGEVIYKKGNENRELLKQKISTSELKRGTYIVTLYSENKIIASEKLILN